MKTLSKVGLVPCHGQKAANCHCQLCGTQVCLVLEIALKLPIFFRFHERIFCISATGSNFQNGQFGSMLLAHFFIRGTTAHSIFFLGALSHADTLVDLGNFKYLTMKCHFDSFMILVHSPISRFSLCLLGFSCITQHTKPHNDSLALLMKLFV